jgi:hypothetical protein
MSQLNGPRLYVGRGGFLPGLFCGLRRLALGFLF